MTAFPFGCGVRAGARGRRTSLPRSAGERPSACVLRSPGCGHEKRLRLRVCARAAVSAGGHPPTARGAAHAHGAAVSSRGYRHARTRARWHVRRPRGPVECVEIDAKSARKYPAYTCGARRADGHRADGHRAGGRAPRARSRDDACPRAEQRAREGRARDPTRQEDDAAPQTPAGQKADGKLSRPRRTRAGIAGSVDRGAASKVSSCRGQLACVRPCASTARGAVRAGGVLRTNTP